MMRMKERRAGEKEAKRFVGREGGKEGGKVTGVRIKTKG